MIAAVNSKKSAQSGEKSAEYYKFWGLTFNKDLLIATTLVVANVFMFILIAWYKWRTDQKMSILLQEQRAGFYRELKNYSDMVMYEYNELHVLNTDMTEKNGYDMFPMVKHLVDNSTMHIPLRSQLKKNTNIPSPSKSPLGRRKPNNSPMDSKIVSMIKLSIQNITSLNSSESNDPYFGAISKIQLLRHRQLKKNTVAQHIEYQEANKNILNAVAPDSFRDRALGVLLGSMVADSCASYFGFLKTTPIGSRVDHCMKMEGGGPHDLAPGQIRNCELQMCLMWGLVERNMNFDKDKVLDLNRTMDYYKGWMQSEPPSEFAFRESLLRAFQLLKEEGSTLQAVLKDSKTQNRRSTSSEALVRLLPLAIWTSTVKNPYVVKKAITAEASFTHQNKLVHSAIFIFFMALQCLLQNPRDDKRGSKAYDYAYELSKQELARGVNQGDSVKEWLEQALNLASQNDSGDQYLQANFNCFEKPDDIKHAFILSFYFLLKARPYKDKNHQFYQRCLHQTIMLGGDVAVNSAIVMGMIGAFVGMKQIPQGMVEKVINFDCLDENQQTCPIPRNEFLSVMRHGLVNLESLIQLRPPPMFELIIQQD